ncbi:LLM class flavin-dependent oxidoreductase [Rhodococcoides yunnanense]|uniref:LLM class flavin-dependent oxidoreductase n=1 Tax=Rhodococcoides yunnanense TaxID=278209 RepID=UPI0009336F4A|nr:LLM class flavin-dependent oxidoreductase [Rhodococcus yunnanensis]
MSSNEKGLFLAVELDGWDESPGQLRRTVVAAEKAGATIVTFGDAIASSVETQDRLDAGTRAAFVSSSTTTVGLAPTVHTLTTEPFFLATQLASLDHASHGRGAWVVGADNTRASHDAVGSVVREADSITREIRDVIELARKLWDSWEDDAVIRDASSGRYLDPDKVHHVRFEGEFFDVVGPLITPRSPQGQIVVIGDADLGVTDLLDIVLVQDSTQTGSARAAGAPLVFADVDATTDIASLAGVVDGVRVRAATAEDATTFVERILPALDEAGVLRRPAAGKTLRANLGLDRPASRYAAAGQNQENK